MEEPSQRSEEEEPMSVIARPPYDPELNAALTVLASQMPPSITSDMIPLLRQGLPIDVDINDVLSAAGVERRDVVIPGYRGDDLAASVLTRRGRTGTGPGIYNLHGGGMIMGDRFTAIDQYLRWVVELDAVVITVEYRLAPEFADPYPVEDSYAGLVWTAEHCAELGIDPDRLVIHGSSAGGGLAAGTVLLARDRKGPRVAGQMLVYPMIDDRDATVSTRQFDGIGVWDRGSNLTGWTALLGDRRGTDDVSIYAAPARATDLRDLPPTFIDCGGAEVFRDEDVLYATALWHAGVDTELHVWPGAFHGFDAAAPQAALTTAAAEARERWIRRIFGV
jgi:acetyl esterase/lipase